MTRRQFEERLRRSGTWPLTAGGVDSLAKIYVVRPSVKAAGVVWTLRKIGE